MTQVRAAALSLVFLALVPGCSRDWTTRDLVPVSFPMFDGSAVQVLMPSGMKLESPGFYSGEDGPRINVEPGETYKTFEAFIAGNPGSAFERRDVETGFGVVYENQGPNVYVQRAVGKNVVNCSGTFSSGTTPRPQRVELLWKICTSMKGT
jgi:hypothetical protein